MANVIITLKVMPTSPDVDLAKVEEEAKKVVLEFKAEVGKVEIKPLAFGIKSLNLIFVMNEDEGSTDDMEAKIGTLEGVQSVEVTDVRRAIG